MKINRVILGFCLACVVAPLWAIEMPEYIKLEANHIIMNGDNWDTLKSELKQMQQSNSDKFNILHIGDSHIQADFSTSVVRRLLQSTFGNGGRGCISALRMAKTNQPVDYTITSTSENWIPARLLRTPWDSKIGITGIATKPNDKEQSISITTKFPDDKFSTITLLHAPTTSYDKAIINGTETIADITSNVFASTFHLPYSTDSIAICLKADAEFYGANIQNSNKGLIYHAIGNNGACFSNYLHIPQFAQQSKEFEPSLIILSMGTNEAFSNQTDDQIYSNISDLILNLSKANPKAKILLLTPMECQRNKKHGQKTLSKNFDINKRVKEVRNVILKYGNDNKIPVWDLYEIAGGDNVSTKWLNDKLMNKDRIHCLKAGYEVQGMLLYNALLEQLK